MAATPAAERDLGIWFSPDRLTGAQSAELAVAVEEAGYSTMWIPEAYGRDPFALAAHLGAATSTLRIATGIANIYHRHPHVMQQGANTVAELTGGRFLLGMGVSSPLIVTRGRGIEYGKPLTNMVEYLDQMAEARYFAIAPDEPVPMVLAALGPKMLALSAERTLGSHPYNVPPEHTAIAREIMGPDAEIMVEQKVMLTNDPASVMETAIKTLAFYNRAPGYVNAWKRLGFTDEDIAGPSPKLVNAIMAIGDEDLIRARIDAHFDAGATHVCVHPMDSEKGMGKPDMDALALLAPK